MLHLRVIAPVELRDKVVDVLSRHAGVAHLVVHRDAALNPAGDEITADIARESANEVIDDLKALDLRRRGAITLDLVDTVVSNAAYRAEKEAEGDPGDAIVWEELSARTREESTLNVTFLLFLCLACMIAAVGVVTDSPVTVVGAMVVGPGVRPVGGAGRGTGAPPAGPGPARLDRTGGRVPGRHGGHRRFRARWRGAGLDSSWAAPVNSTEVDFIFQVGPLSFVVALLAGAAGMLSLVSAKSAALVGVFISVTTVPAAGFAVVAASVGEWDVAVESAAQLAINLVGITLAGVVVLAVRRRHETRRSRG